MALFDALSNVGTEIFYNIPKSLVTGQYQGIASPTPVTVPSNVRFPMVGGIISEAGGIATGGGLTLAQKLFGPGKTVAEVPGAISGGISYGKAGLIGLGGVAAGALGSWLFGGKPVPQIQQAAPQEAKPIIVQQPTITPTVTPVVTIQPVVTQPNITTYNQQQYDYSSIYNYMANSPGATISNKKGFGSPAATNIPSWSTPFTTTTPTSLSIPLNLSAQQPIDQTQRQGQAQGTDLTTIAIIAAIGLVAYGAVSKRK